jgi:predicted O-methyltransferase YrrM
MNLTTLFFRLVSFSKYYYKAQSDLYIHSPFIFEWINAIKVGLAVEIISIKNYRNSLQNDNSEFKFIDFGKINLTNISARYVKTSITDLYGKVLLATSAYIQAKTFIELGTSFGVSTAYIYSSNSIIKGTTIDANPIAIDKSKELFNLWYPAHIVNFVNGNFDKTLPIVINELSSVDFVFIDGDHKLESTLHYLELIMPSLAENAAVILDDIRWSPEMYKAWLQASQHADFNYVVDYGRIGVLFKVNNHSPKQYFTIH